MWFESQMITMADQRTCDMHLTAESALHMCNKCDMDNYQTQHIWCHLGQSNIIEFANMYICQIEKK